VALIVAVATVLGTLATVLGVGIAMRSQRRSDRDPVYGERRQSSIRYTGLGATQLESDTVLTIPADLQVTHRTAQAVWVAYDQVRGEMSVEEFRRAIEQQIREGALSLAVRSVAEQASTFEAVARASKAAGRSSRSVGLRTSRPARRSRPAVAASIPSWATRLMPAADARRYTWEWGAHLYQLVEEGQLKQARRDRRMLALAGLLMAMALRARKVLSRVN
jgi:hypothetical protein